MGKNFFFPARLGSWTFLHKKTYMYVYCGVHTHIAYTRLFRPATLHAP